MLEREYDICVENTKLHFLAKQIEFNHLVNSRERALHRHISAELFAIEKGTANIFVENEKITLQQGDLAIVPISVLHCLDIPQEGTLVSSLIFISNKTKKERNDDIYKRLSSFTYCNAIAIWRDQPNLCKKATEICGKQVEHDASLIALRALELLLSLSPQKAMQIPSHHEIRKSKLDINRMMMLDSIIASHYADHIVLEEIASKLFISGRQLDRIARKRYGKTIHRVIMEVRINEAVRLLISNPDMSIASIGKTVGFSSSSGFYREFKQAFGVTPYVYRNQKSEDCEDK